MGQQIDYGNVAAGMAMDATGSLINNLKTKSLKRLQEGKLTKKQQADIEELLKTIDEILEIMKKPTDKTDWQKVWEIVINVLGIGLPYLIKTLSDKNK